MPQPDSIVTRMMSLALHHHGANRLAEAERLYREVIAEDPNHAEAHHLLGLLMQQAGKPEDAVEQIAAAVAINDADPAYFYSLGLVMADMGRGVETVACLRRAVELAPHFAEAHEALASTWRAMGRYEQAATAAYRARQGRRLMA